MKWLKNTYFLAEYPLLIEDWLIWLMQLLFYLIVYSNGFFYRPCISDDLKIGYHSRDHATQTDIKEIPELNELAIATQALIEVK